MLIDTGRFEACFEEWARSFGVTLDREVVAIDGKTIRGSLIVAANKGRFTLSVPGPAIDGWCPANARSETNIARRAGHQRRDRHHPGRDGGGEQFASRILEEGRWVIS